MSALIEKRPRRTRRILLLAGALCIVVAALVLTIADTPPREFLVRSGPHEASGPTGRTVLVGGLRFHEFAPGYIEVGSHFGCRHPFALDRLLGWTGWEGETGGERAGVGCPREYVEIPGPIWISELLSEREEVLLLRFDEAVRSASEFTENHEREVRLPTGVELEYVMRTGGFDHTGAEWCDDRRPLHGPVLLDVTFEISRQLDALLDDPVEEERWIADNMRTSKGGPESASFEPPGAWRGLSWIGFRMRCRLAFVSRPPSE